MANKRLEASGFAKQVTDQRLDRFAVERMRAYGTEVIEDRALPDYRDGLFPVHRRIIWSMYQEKMRSSGGRKKAARIVGDVLGKYHPHGDLSVYSSMVMMENQPHPLISGQGNWGRFGEKAAHMRYCFAAGTLISTARGLVPIEKIPQILGIKSNRDRIAINLPVESRDKPLRATKWLRMDLRSVYQVETEYTSVKATNNEPLLVLGEDAELSWKQIQNLQVGDLVCYHRQPKIAWPHAQQLLQMVIPTPREKNIGVPRRFSTNLAEWLGLVISEGSITLNAVQFMNSDRNLVKRFVQLTNQIFASAHTSVTWRKPDGWATKPYAQVTINSRHLVRWLTANDVPATTAHYKYIPACIFTGARKEVVAFFRAAFEGDGSNSNGTIYYNSKSQRLLKDFQLLLLTRFGLPFKKSQDRIYLCGKDFYDEFMRQLGFISLRKSIISNYTIAENSPINWLRNIQTYIQSHRVTGNGRNHLTNEHGDNISLYSHAGLALNAVPLRWADFRIWFKDCRTALQEHFPSIFDKINRIIQANYFFVPIRKITKLAKEITYDLTVPGSNAFTANGMVVHNTETRLAPYAEKVLLTRNYIKTIKYRPNYDGEEREPIYLPALLPHYLINGMSGIAVGVTVNVPPFAIAGIVKLLTMIYQGKSITAKDCAKHLQIEYPAPYNSKVLTQPADLLEFYTTGKGRLTLAVDYTTAGNEMLITKFPPHFAMADAKIKLLIKVPEVARVDDISDGAVKVLRVTLKGGTDVLSRSEIFRKCAQLLEFSLNLRINYIHRLDEDRVKFGSCDMPTWLMRWAKWRTRLEVRTNKYILRTQQAQLLRQQTMLLACKSLEIIFEELKRRAEDLEGRLANRLKITVEQAAMIAAMQVRSLSALSANKIIEEIRQSKGEIAMTKTHIAKPTEKILQDLPALVRSL